MVEIYMAWQAKQSFHEAAWPWNLNSQPEPADLTRPLFQLMSY
jgi:hypothetical protein